ncbi:hypothetical protein DL96DRAFT_1668499 [Flagelloscypha sp. PMI_526]|nr:hypothetical protein DL96DRAFT_1668499 [Flagelloscypha sp. PMI_526]
MRVKPEPSETPLFSFSAAINGNPLPSTRVKAEPGSIYQDATEINYTPENTINHGIDMVNVIEQRIKALQLGNLRKEVWARDILTLKSQAAPTTLIAVCGATGAGKSSTLNAILDDNIVPTSGFRACTAVVTEIAYHTKKGIDADSEWREELATLKDDLVDEDGSLKRTNDLKSDAGIAWSKVNSVYPSLTQENVATMPLDDIIRHDPTRNSKEFATEIAKYIDSKDKRVADANAARNNIAKDYMKKADCIWILAPITRAVDDKTARDLLGDAFKTQLLMDGAYDDSTITFIATKCDDISPSEIIDQLDLEDEPELVDIEEKLENLKDAQADAARKENAAKKNLKGIEAELKHVRAVLKVNIKKHLEAVKNGKDFTPKLTKPSANDKTVKESSSSKKRKNMRKGKSGSPKRMRSSSPAAADSDTEMDSPDEDEDENSDESNESDSDSEEEHSDASDKDSESEFESNASDEEQEEEEQEEVTEEYIENKIKESKDKIKEIRDRLNEARKERKSANEALGIIKPKIANEQRKKASFCSERRSQFSKEILREDFRTGLKQMDDSHAEEHNPDTFDPTQNVRDYDAISLPVFTVSARDYARIKGQAKGDGEPSTFTDPQLTEVPLLQSWCKELTVASRERTARNFLVHLATFSKTVESYTRGIGDVTEADRTLLREKWETSEYEVQDDSDDDSDDDPFEAILSGQRHPLYSMPRYEPKVGADGRPVGIRARLEREFQPVINKCEEDLNAAFNDGLEAKCQEGIVAGAAGAVQTVDTFAASIHWATYRATLRRHGAFRHDLNVDLAGPFTRSIAQSWGKVFEQQLLGGVQKDIETVIKRIIDEVEASAALGLKERTRLQGQTCLEEMTIAVKSFITDISRSIAPNIQNELIPGYDRAMEERGKGSVARQKTFFRTFVDECKDDLFEGSSDAIMVKLNEAAKAAAEALRVGTLELADKIEVNMSVLWEGVRDDPQQVRARAELVRTLEQVQRQLLLLKQAATLKQNSQDSDVKMASV